MDLRISRLEDGSIVYADHAGAGLHCDGQAVAMAQLLNATLAVNPHTGGPDERMLEMRRRVLSFFNADPREYAVIWTASATAALKLVGENFDWAKRPVFAHHANVHNSALGIREYAKAHGASFQMVTDARGVDSMGANRGGLFAVSGECNFSGVKPDLVELVRELHERSWLVCVDAAALAATNVVDLTVCRADFVALSFYKIFGLPSGLGALLVRREAVERAFVSQKPYFGGGTVEAAASSVDYVSYRRDVSARYEDGTVAFLSILTLGVSFDLLTALGGMQGVQRRVFQLAADFARQLLALQHHNGRPAFVVYGKWAQVEGASEASQGPIVTFNAVRADGSWIGYHEVGRLAQLHKIVVRTGCFCNAGACEQWIGLTPNDIQRNLQSGHVCWDDRSLMNGRPTGAVRVSFGWPSTALDVRRIIEFLSANFVECSPPVPLRAAELSGQEARLENIWLYPVKSCGGMAVQQWEVGSHGLLYDREWALVGEDGAHLSQKTLPAMCRITATVDMARARLVLAAPTEEANLELPLIPSLPVGGTGRESVLVCGDTCEVLPYRDNACSAWLERVLQRRCTLVRMAPSAVRRNADTRGHSNALLLPAPAPTAQISFANEAQFLVLSTASLSILHERLGADRVAEGHVSRFRANLVVAGPALTAHIEDEARIMTVGDQHVFASTGPCARCEMVCIDSSTLQRSREPLRTLASYRRVQGRILFGSLFAYVPSLSATTPCVLAVGDVVRFSNE
jgi:molybdenum cofactor sulfurtransferase